MRSLVCATRAATIRYVPTSNRRGVARSPGLVVDGPACPDGVDGSVSMRIALPPPYRPASGAECARPSPREDDFSPEADASPAPPEPRRVGRHLSPRDRAVRLRRAPAVSTSVQREAPWLRLTRVTGKRRGRRLAGPCVQRAAARSRTAAGSGR